MDLTFSRENILPIIMNERQPGWIRLGIIGAMLEEAVARKAEEEAIARGEQPRDPVFTNGMVIQKSDHSFYIQAAKNLGGTKVEDLGDTFASGRKLSPTPKWYKRKYGEPSEAMVVRVNREDGVRDL